MKSSASKVLTTIYLLTLFSFSYSLATPSEFPACSKGLYEKAAFRPNTYSWANPGHASSYIVVLTPRASGAPLIFQTEQDYIILSGITHGVYKVKVYAVYGNKHSFEIVNDTITIGGTTTDDYPPTVPSEDI